MNNPFTRYLFRPIATHALRVSDFLKSKCSASVRQMIIGLWDLVSFEAHTHSTTSTHAQHPLGSGRSGLLVYTADNHVSVMKFGCPPFNAFYFSASDTVITEAGRLFLAYAGTYTLHIIDGKSLVNHLATLSNFLIF